MESKPGVPTVPAFSGYLLHCCTIKLPKTGKRPDMGKQISELVKGKMTSKMINFNRLIRVALGAPEQRLALGPSGGRFSLACGRKKEGAAAATEE